MGRGAIPLTPYLDSLQKCLRWVACFQLGFTLPIRNKGPKENDCIALASTGLNCLNMRRAANNMIQQVDIAKAFDTISWDFYSY